MKIFDPKNLTGKQVILLLAPLVSVFVPVLILGALSEHQFARVVFGGWNLIVWMAGTYLVVRHFAKRKLDEYSIKVDDSN